jgi:agmatinase
MNAWRKEVNERILRARVFVLGVPSDTGAGIRRGAAYGPRAVRTALLEKAEYRSALSSAQILDLGDVLVNPQLLHDSMLSARQIELCRKEMYAALPATKRKLPVSALSQTKWALEQVLKINPEARIFVIGGDHSVAWPVTEALHSLHKRKLGIVQPDAHTDLLPTRLGIRYCFGTWSFHANELLKKDKPMPKSGNRFIQFGIRQSGKDKSHWESATGVKQFWSEDILKSSPEQTIQQAVQALKQAGVTKVYFSNDIDGTDGELVPATGTPAAQGPGPAFFLALIRKLGAEFEMVGADIMEVAPDLADSEGRRKTLHLAAEYSWASLEAQLRR